MATSTAPRRRAGTARARSRWLLLSGGGLGCGAALLALGFAVLSDPIADVHEYASRVAPAHAALEVVATESMAAQLAFVTAITAADDPTRAASFSDTQAASAALESAWERYSSFPPAGPGENRLRAEFERERDVLRVLGSRLATLPATAPAFGSAFADERASVARQQAILDDLREIYAPKVQTTGEHIDRDLAIARALVIATASVLAVAYAALALAVLRGSNREERRLAADIERFRSVGEQVDFEAALQRGLDMAHTEAEAERVVRRALAAGGNAADVEAHVADERGHLRRAVGGTSAGCGVCELAECPAAAGGHPLSVDTSRALDACPLLHSVEPPVWALCVPIGFAGRTVGAIHAQAPADQERPVALARRLELIAHRLGERISSLRLLDQTALQARTDPLTGLTNRRELSVIAERLLAEAGAPYVLGYADLDHFKRLNDEHGHDVGDRALRLFARVLRESVRPDDIVARHGGEEFVVVLPACELPDARAVAERVRTDLAAALRDSSVPAFTVTIGLAESRLDEAFGDVLRRADAALLRGKAEGRDRVVADGDVHAVAAG